MQVDEVISPSALNDINVVTWLTFFVVMACNAYTNRWFTFLWTCSLNLALTAILRVMIQVRSGEARSYECVDVRLRNFRT